MLRYTPGQRLWQVGGSVMEGRQDCLRQLPTKLGGGGGGGVGWGGQKLKTCPRTGSCHAAGAWDWR